MSEFRSQILNSQYFCGFTLLEVMIALSIVSIALMVILGSQSQGLSLANEARFNTTASLLAQEKMAEMEAVRERGELSSDSGDFGEAFPDYVWRLSVHDVSLEGVGRVSDRLRQIDLEITYVPDSRYQYRLRRYRFFPKG